MDNINYSKLKEAEVVVNFISKRYSKGLYSLVLFSGLPGSGKSSSCIRLAELVSEDLTGKNIITSTNVIDSLLELVKFVQSAKSSEVNIAVIEEISVLFPSRRAMSGDNVDIQKVLDTCRKKKVILIANAPIWTSIDSHIRMLGNLYIEALRINKLHQVVICKSLRLQTNPGTGKTYWHWLRRNGKSIQRIIFRKPNQKTWDEYELRKDKFMDSLYEQLKIKAEKKNVKLMKDIRRKKSIVKPLSPNELKIYDCIERKGLNQTETAREMGKHNSYISRAYKNIQKKLKLEKEPVQKLQNKTESLENQPLDITTPNKPPIK